MYRDLSCFRPTRLVYRLSILGLSWIISINLANGILENIVARVVSRAILRMFFFFTDVFFFLFGVDCFFYRSLFRQTFILELFFFFDNVVLDLCTCLSIGTTFLLVVLSITLSSITPLLLESQTFLKLRERRRNAGDMILNWQEYDA